MIDNISDLIGCKFKTHGRNKVEGFDCLGLAIEVLRRNGKTLKDVYYTSLDDATKGEVYSVVENYLNVEKIGEPCDLCLVAMKQNGAMGHVGVYVGDGKFIHATKKMGVCLEKLRLYKSIIGGFYYVNN